jgi:hypothetical protein
MGASGSQSSGQSQGSATNDALNLSQQQSAATSSSTSDATSGSFVDPTQMGFLTNLFGNAEALAGSGQDAVDRGNVAGDQNQGLLDAGLNSVQGQLDTKGQVRQQTDALKSGLGSLFRDEINPAIESNAIMGGGLGSGRAGVAQGVAQGQIADAFTQGLAAITGQANQQALNASSLIPQLGQANIGNANAGQTAGLDIMGRLAAILGGPTVLNQSNASSATNSNATSVGQSFGISQGRQQQTSSDEAAQFGFSFV